MQKDLLTAKEWFEKGFAPVKNLIADEGGSIQQKYFEECMEEYATYRNRELEGKILGFRQEFNNIHDYGNPDYMRDYYDEYFGITCTREGKIN